MTIIETLFLGVVGGGGSGSCELGYTKLSTGILVAITLRYIRTDAETGHASYSEMWL